MQGTVDGPNFESSQLYHFGHRMKGLHWHKVKQIFNQFYDF